MAWHCHVNCDRSKDAQKQLAIVIRISVLSEYEEGGLQMTALNSMIKSLRLAWLELIFNENNGTYETLAPEREWQNIIWNNKEIRIDKKQVFYKNYFEFKIYFLILIPKTHKQGTLSFNSLSVIFDWRQYFWCQEKEIKRLLFITCTE